MLGHCFVRFIGQGSEKIWKPKSLSGFFIYFIYLVNFFTYLIYVFFLLPSCLFRAWWCLLLFQRAEFVKLPVPELRSGDTVPAEWLKSHRVCGTDRCQTNVSELRQLWYFSRKSCHGKQNHTRNDNAGNAKPKDAQTLATVTAHQTSSWANV